MKTCRKLQYNPWAVGVWLAVPGEVKPLAAVLYVFGEILGKDEDRLNE